MGHSDSKLQTESIPVDQVSQSANSSCANIAYKFETYYLIKF